MNTATSIASSLVIHLLQLPRGTSQCEGDVHDVNMSRVVTEYSNILCGIAWGKFYIAWLMVRLMGVLDHSCEALDLRVF
jgi:hypothetical protein